MSTLSTLGYAVMAASVYDDAQTVVGAFARQVLRRDDKCGFHAALYSRPSGTGVEYILSFAGSETSEGGVDWLADVGFGGKGSVEGLQRAGAVMQVLGRLPGPAAIGGMIGTMATNSAVSIAKKGQLLLQQQQNHALQMAYTAMQTANGAKLTLTGHSLGGGLAQIAAAYSGLPAVTFSAPAVSAVDGASASFARKKPTIVNFRIKNDPVNVSELAGTRLGRVVTIMSPRSTAGAHQIGGTIAELTPQGQFSVTGGADPFTVTATSVTS